MSQVTLFCFWASYLSALGIELARRRWDTTLLRGAGWIAIAAGMLAHTAYLYVRSQAADLPPLLGSPQDWLLVLAWLVIATLLVASRLLPSVSLGTYLLPPTIAIVSVAYFVDDRADTSLRDNYWWVFVHSAILVVGLGGLVLSFVTSLMYLNQHRRLKLRQPPAAGARLLDLETLSRWNWWCVVIAVPLITIGFAMGATLSLASTAASESVPLTGLPIIMLFVLWLGMVGLLAWMIVKPQVSGTAVAVRTVWACGFVLAIVLSLTLLSPTGGVHGAPRQSAEQLEDLSPTAVGSQSAAFTAKELG